MKRQGKTAEATVVPHVFNGGTRRLWALLTEGDPSRKEGEKKGMGNARVCPYSNKCVCVCVYLRGRMCVHVCAHVFGA